MIEQMKLLFSAEIKALEDTCQAIEQPFVRAVEMILAAPGKVVVTGLGKSGIIGHKIAATFASTGQTAIFLNAAEALHGDLGMVNQGDIVIMLSNSAATAELVAMLPSLRRIGAQTIGLFGSSETRLARSVDLLIPIIATTEGCPLKLAPMASSTATLVVGDAIAGALMQRRGFRAEDFALYHPAGMLGRRLLLKVEDVMHRDQAIAAVNLKCPMRQLVAEMTRTALGAIGVVENQQLIGIISDGDVRRAITRDNPLELTAADIMTPNPTVTHPNASLGEVLDLMESPQRKIYVLPVVDENQTFLGIIRMHDIVSQS